MDGDSRTVGPGDPIRVLYVAGYGRSGSTVLDMILDNHPEVVGLGELVNLPRAAWLGGDFCACGHTGQACPFWSEVRRVWTKATGVRDPAEYVDLQKRYERLYDLPRLWRESLRPTPGFRRYAELTVLLYRAIRTVSARRVLVDSSKSPARGYALSLMSGVDLRVLHLIRDGRGVAWSLIKAYRKDPRAGIQRDFHPISAWRTSLKWAATNLAAERIGRARRASTPMLRMKYEDLVASPRTEIRRIGDLVGVDLGELADRVATGATLRPGHTVAGNRVRMSGAVRLTADVEWTEKLGARRQAIFWMLAGPVARRYGYARVESRAVP